MWPGSRFLKKFLLSYCLCLTSFLQEVAPVPCQTPLGLLSRSPGSRSVLSFKIQVSSSDESHDLLHEVDYQWEAERTLEDTYIQVTASKIVLLTGLLFQGNGLGQGRILDWTLALSEDCQHYHQQDYSVAEEDILDLHESVKVHLFSYAFVKCLRLIPNRFIGKTAPIKFELLGCEIGTDNTLCEKDLLLTSGITTPKNDDIVLIYDENVLIDSVGDVNNNINNAEDAFSRTIDELNTTEIYYGPYLVNTDLDAIDLENPNGTDSSFEPIISSTVADESTDELIRNLTRDMLSNDERLVLAEYRHETHVKFTSHSELSRMQSDLLVNDELANTMESQHEDYQRENEAQVNITQEHREESFFGDIALIKLESPVEFTKTVSPLCIDETDIFLRNALCYATGWGQRSTESPGSRMPHTTALFVMTLDECEEVYAGLSHDHDFKTYVRTEEDVLCAYGKGGEDTCQGDSGGGLMCSIDNKWHLVGITVGGFECGNKDFPGFYTRVTHYQKWIAMNMQHFEKLY